MTLANIDIPAGVEITMVSLALDTPQACSPQRVPVLVARSGELITVMLFGETGCVVVKSPLVAAVELRL
jgi:hypothetical protein